MNFGVGLSFGMVTGMGVGIAIGVAAVRGKLKELLDAKKIKVTDPDGNELSSDQLNALLAEKRKKG